MARIDATPKDAFAARLALAATRAAVFRAGWPRAAQGFVAEPEPRSIGDGRRGRRMQAGPWDAPGREAHGFGWLDDLAAAGGAAARARAQEWTRDWLRRFGRGRGPGWAPDLTGRRLIRWINHAAVLLDGQGPAERAAFIRALSVQTRFLSRKWRTAAPGRARIEALTGLISAGLALDGMVGVAGLAAAALGHECVATIDAGGGIASRNPEELLEIFTHLTWAAQALAQAGESATPDHRAAIQRIAPTLRALRHADGSLARFHGGGRGAEGRLDQALAASGVRAAAGEEPAMGYLRLSGGRTTLLVDAADPPQPRAGASAHASTLAFELTSGRRALVVGCGSGAPFGPDWQRAGRATASHSTLSMEGYSSSRLEPGLDGRLADRAHVNVGHPAEAPEGHVVRLSHDGWVATHGLTHARLFVLSRDGRHLGGHDELCAHTPEDRARLARAIVRAPGRRIRFSVHFHLHPEVEVTMDADDDAVSLHLRSGEVWQFRQSGAGAVALERSVYLEAGQPEPRASRQIVLTGHVAEFDARVDWTLAKSDDTPVGVRDIAENGAA